MADDFTLGESEDFVATGVDLGAGEGERWSEHEDGSLQPESDPFIGNAIRWARRRAKALAPILKRVAPIAARAVLGSAGGHTAAVLGGMLREDDLKFEWEDEGEWESFDLLDDEDDSESEDEAERVPGLDPESEALVEALAAFAQAAESEDEASGLIGGVTIQILAPTPIRIRRLTPAFVRRTTRLTKLLRRSPSTRPLVPVVASIAKRTTRSLVRRAATGERITPATVGQVMARHTARTLASQKRVAGALAKNTIQRRRLDQRRIARAER